MILHLLAICCALASSSIFAETVQARHVRSAIEDAKKTEGRTKSKALDEIAAHSPQEEDDVDALVSAIRDGDKGLQIAAMRSLRRVPRTAKKLKPQAEKLLNDSSEKVQLAGIIMADALEAKELAPKIRAKLAERPRFKVRKNNFGGITPEALQYAEEAARVLVEMKDFDSIPELLSRDEIMGFSSFGGPLVAKFGARALPQAVALARQKETLRSDGGRSVISSMKDPEAIPQLIDLAHDSDGAIASAATLALSLIPTEIPADKAKVEAALFAQISNKDGDIRGSAYDGLLRINPRKHLPAALDALKKEREVRLAIFYAIQKNKLTEAVPALEAFIKEDEVKHPNWTNQRAVAAQTIFKLVGKRVPYKGVERDRRVYPDPYDPSKAN